MSEQGTVSYADCVAMEIRAEAARQRLSGRALAMRVHRATTTVSRWLNGATPISLDDQKLLADALGLSTATVSARAEETYARIAAVETQDAGLSSVTKQYRASTASHIRIRHDLPWSGIGHSRRGRSGDRLKRPNHHHTVTNLCRSVAA